MRYLYTGRENVRYGNVFVFIILVIRFIDELIDKGLPFGRRFSQDLIIAGIIELILLCIWYPGELRKKLAIKKGNAIDGIITDILCDKGKKKELKKSLWKYYIVVKTGTQTENIKFGAYGSDPGEYVSVNDKCKVYEYHNKFYLDKIKIREKSKNIQNNPIKSEIHYPSKKEMNYMVNNIVHPIEWIEKADCSEALKANVEWQELSYIGSKECLYLPPMYFKNIKPYFVLFAEVHIKSGKKYTVYSFNLESSIQKYMDTNDISPMYDEQIFIAGLKELIIKQIKSYDKGVVVTDIAVVIKSFQSIR